MLGPAQVLQPVGAEIQQFEGFGEQLARRVRHEHLATMSGGHDPSGVVHVQADVRALHQLRLAGMDADANRDLTVLRPCVRGERLLRAGGCRDRVANGGEGDEERISLRVDLVPVLGVKCLAKQAPVHCEQVGVGVTGALQQLRRSLDVREQERDCARRRRRHRASIAHGLDTRSGVDESASCKSSSTDATYCPGAAARWRMGGMEAQHRAPELALGRVGVGRARSGERYRAVAFGAAERQGSRPAAGGAVSDCAATTRRIEREAGAAARAAWSGCGQAGSGGARMGSG